MTSIMRKQWEQYGDVLFLDAMKRQLNNQQLLSMRC